jgi:hypothetical protein
LTGLGRALAVPRLQQPQLALFDGELHVLHVAVVLLQAARNFLQLIEHLGHVGFELFDGQGGAYAGHHVLALGIDQVVPFEHRFASGGIARHEDPGGRVVAHVAEHHGLDVDRGTVVVVDSCRLAVVDRTFAVPGAEHGLGGLAQLFERVGREFLAGVGADNLLEAHGNGLPGIGIELGIVADVGLPALGRDDGLEHLVRDPHDHTAEHLDQSPVQIVGKARSMSPRGELGGNLVVQADVQDGVHHPRH